MTAILSSTILVSDCFLPWPSCLLLFLLQDIFILHPGERPLFLNVDLPPDITIFRGRPDLEKAISAIIYSVANNESLPDDLYSRNSVITRATPEQRVRLLLERTMSIYSIDQLFQYSAGLTPSHHQGRAPWRSCKFFWRDFNAGEFTWRKL